MRIVARIGHAGENGCDSRIGTEASRATTDVIAVAGRICGVVGNRGCALRTRRFVKDDTGRCRCDRRRRGAIIVKGNDRLRIGDQIDVGMR